MDYSQALSFMDVQCLCWVDLSKIVIASRLGQLSPPSFTGRQMSANFVQVLFGLAFYIKNDLTFITVIITSFTKCLLIGIINVLCLF